MYKCIPICSHDSLRAYLSPPELPLQTPTCSRVCEAKLIIERIYCEINLFNYMYMHVHVICKLCKCKKKAIYDIYETYFFAYCSLRSTKSHLHHCVTTTVTPISKQM